MNDKNKILLKEVSLVLIDQIVSGIPELNIAWGLSKALYGTGMKLREKRVFEWVEVIKDNPGVFVPDLLKTEEFQDGFVYFLEEYLRERNKQKRVFIKNTFLNFSISNNKDNFPAEKIVHSISQLEIKDIEVLKDSIAEENRLREKDERNLSFQIYGNNDKNRENIYNLLNLGIFIGDDSSRLGHLYSPFIQISEFGRTLIKYIIN